MKSNHYRILGFALAAACSTSYSLAQEAAYRIAQDETTEPPIAYGYNHTVELSMGTGRNLKDYSQLSDLGIGLMGHDAWGFEFNLRYTRFLSRHWGAYAQIDALRLGTSSDQLERGLAPHYNHNGKEVLVSSDILCFSFLDFGSFYQQYLLGAAYRYDVGRWSFRSRLGAGFLCQSSGYASFYVMDSQTRHDYEEVQLRTTNNRGEMPDDFYAFAYSPSLQVTFTPCTHFFFSAEVQWTGTIGHLYQHTQAYQYYAYEEQHWKPDEYGFFCPGRSELIGKTDDHFNRMQMGNFLQLRLGFGWNIGWNRNASKRF